MNLKDFTNHQLLKDIKIFASKEREALVAVLHHLKEIDRRKLFCDLGYSSLFNYAVKELQYSEDQAARRIQAMRLIRDIPQVEEKIASGILSLSNAHKVQSTLQKMQQAEPRKIIPMSEKLDLVDLVSGKSTREAERELIKLSPEISLPQERERALTETKSEVRFVMNDSLRAKLQNIRCLLGCKASGMSYADLFEKMADLSEKQLLSKKFGVRNQFMTQEVLDKNALLGSGQAKEFKNSRYIPQKTKLFIWQRDQSRCSNCNSTQNLQIDHIKPVALGGNCDPDNLRLLCFHCNQRASIKMFGVFEKKKIV